MSHWIEYQSACFTLTDTAASAGTPSQPGGPRYVIACEGGSNNLTQRGPDGRERRVREWYIAMLGTRQQVMRQAVRIAAACEGGDLKPTGRCATPEQYIARVRRQLLAPRPDVERHITLSARVPEHHELIALAAAEGYVVYPDSFCGQTEVKLIPKRQDRGSWADYLRLLDPYLDDGSLSPALLGQVWLQPRS